jgi:hypothetical protein
MESDIDLAILDALMKGWNPEEDEEGKGKKKAVTIIIGGGESPVEDEGSTEEDQEEDDGEEMDEDPFCEEDIDTALPSGLKEKLQKIAKKK